MLKRLRRRIPDWLWAGVVTGLFTGLTPFVLALGDWLEGVAAWAAGDPVLFPDVSVVRSATVGLVFGGIAGGANAVYRYLQTLSGRGSPPEYFPGVGPTS